MLSLIQRMIYGPKSTYVLDIPMLRDCVFCKSCVKHHMANRLTAHLVQVHKLSDEDAHQTVDTVFALLTEHLRKLKTK